MYRAGRPICHKVLLCFPCELWVPAWEVGSYSISQSAGENIPNYNLQNLATDRMPRSVVVHRREQEMRCRCRSKKERNILSFPFGLSDRRKDPGYFNSFCLLHKLPVSTVWLSKQIYIKGLMDRVGVRLSRFLGNTGKSILSLESIPLPILSSELSES